MSDPVSSYPVGTGLEHPSGRERMMFALGCHQLAVSLAIMASSVLLAVAAGVAIASLSDKRLMLSLFLLASVSGGVAAMLAVKPPWLVRIAKPGHIAAALESATDHERPYLLASLESRLHRPSGRNPITLSDLAMVFASIRAEHGERARQRQARSARALATQEEALAQVGRGSAAEHPR